MEDTAIRELKEESTLVAKASDLEKRAIIDFVFPAKPTYNQRVHIYFLSEWIGEPERTDEMDPKWFSLNAIPYKNMWDSDTLWLPKLLEKEHFHAIFFWKEDNETVDTYTINPAISLDDW
ncbi:MAG: 8-oxo-dGTP diphosphatase [Candidatus Woesearchaeota archaeon]